MKKFLLKSEKDYLELLDRQWLANTLSKPSSFPCVAIVKDGYYAYDQFIQFVYPEDFNG